MKGAKLIELTTFSDARGYISIIENAGEMAFEPQRVYFLYDIPENTIRGGHAHKTSHQIILASITSCILRMPVISFLLFFTTRA